MTDPRTGYPVEHSLLSATVFAPTCMEADALATACMVLGVDSAVQMLQQLDGVGGYLIYSTAEGMDVVQYNMPQ